MGTKWPPLPPHYLLSTQQSIAAWALNSGRLVDELRDWFICTAGAWSWIRKASGLSWVRDYLFGILFLARLGLLQCWNALPWSRSDSMAKWCSVSWSVLLIYQGKVYGNVVSLCSVVVVVVIVFGLRIIVWRGNECYILLACFSIIVESVYLIR